MSKASQSTTFTDRDSQLSRLLLDDWPGLNEKERYQRACQVVSTLTQRNAVHKSNGPLGSKGEPATETLRQLLLVLLRHSRREGLQIVFGQLVKKIVVNCGKSDRVYRTAPNTLYLYQTEHLMDWYDETASQDTVRMLAGLMYDDCSAQEREGFDDFYSACGPLTNEMNCKDEATYFLARSYLASTDSNWKRVLDVDTTRPLVLRSAADRIAWTKTRWKRYGVTV
ncbi:MAG: hypothetical protein SGI77_10355 [Pirellulaceae bacterium]|nr:hypothetical protein [Pirellulaceae bacterium]